jgi:predicted nucleic-acid-binding protein
MGRKLIDANVILRYLLNDDKALFERASALLEKVKIGEETVIIPESVLSECVYVLLKIYRIDRPTVAEKLKGLFLYKGVMNSDKKDLIDSLTLLAKGKLSIVDCILCAKSLNHRMLLFTFDDELEKKCSKNLS